jgi:hypothetical protein
MGLDTPAKAALADVSDMNGKAGGLPQGDTTLSRLQEGAGLQDHPFNSKLLKGIDEIGKGDKGPDDGLGAIGKILFERQEPSDKERASAEKTLEGRMSKLIPEADRDAMKAMTTAITNGDTKAFAEAVKKAGGNPEKLKALVGEVDKMLQEKGSPTRLDVTADGKVLVSDSDSGKGLAFDPKTGNVEAKAIEQNMDGSVLVKPGELLHVDTDKTFKDMGDHAVNAVNGKLDFSVIKRDPFDPIKPFEPHRPWFPEEPNPLQPKFPHIDPKWLEEELGGKGGHVILDKSTIKPL